MAWALPLLRTLSLLVFLVSLSTSYTPLSDETLKKLPSSNGAFDIKTGSLLAPLLIPRVPGTPGQTLAQNHLINFFRDSLPSWTLAFQNSSSKTPATGDALVPFMNIIATRDPPWAKEGDVGRLTLVAHYDSKLKPEGFIGATDSAAPVAMIMHAVKSVDAALTRKWDAMVKNGEGGLEEDVGVQVLFLDGEEAFVSWTDDDSLYGSRSLAEEWESTFHPAHSTYHTPLSSISLFVLLDLLGASSPAIPSYFKTTHWAYTNLANLETRLRDLSLLASTPPHPFLIDADRDPNSRFSSQVSDDHLPFLARGVEVLHLIPVPFPRVWHTMNDDGEHLDGQTVEDWGRLVTAFVAEWMDLEGFMDGQGEQMKEKGNQNRMTRRDELHDTS